jgi:hypothetical protein
MSREVEEGIVLMCEICDRAAIGRYCEIHEQAYHNLVEKFDVWRGALNLKWKEYLEEIIRNPLTGEKAKEVAESLLSNL